MKLLTHVLLIILWSSLIPLSSIANGKTQSNASTPVVSDAFTIFPNLKKIDPSFNKEIKNMPAIQSQDTVGSCFGCASATIVQKFLCDADPETKKAATSCSQLPREKIISQLSLVAFAKTNSPNLTPGDTDNHTNITLYEDRIGTTSSSSNALMNSIDMLEFMPESCFPFDQLVAKYGNEDSSLFKNVYDKTRNLFFRMQELKNKADTEGSTFQCDDCLKQLGKDFNTTFSAETLSSAIAKDSYGEFLYSLIFNNCTSFSSNKRPSYKQFPQGTSSIEKKTGVFNKIKEVIDKDKPILMSSICIIYDSAKKTCLGSHDTVISGYRKVCPDENYSSNKCRMQLKLHNCWGQDWQNANNDGWLDADKLIEYMNEKKDHIRSGDLSWLE